MSPGSGHAPYCHHPCAAGQVRQTLTSHSAPPTLLSDWSEMTRCRTFPSPLSLPCHTTQHLQLWPQPLTLLGNLSLPQRFPLMKTSSNGQAKPLGCNGVVPNPHPTSPSVKICLWRYRNTQSNRAPMPPLASSDVRGHRVDFCTQPAFGSKHTGLLILPFGVLGTGKGKPLLRPWLWGCSC